VLHDLGMIDFTEPFRRLMNQGQVILDGKAMSKSTGNLVELGEQIDRYGVDVVRLALLFSGPPEEDIDWADVSTRGMSKFLARAHRLALEVTSPAGTAPQTGQADLRQIIHRTVHEAEAFIEGRRFNVAIARLMELVTAVRRAIDAGLDGADPAVREGVEAVAVLLSLFAPYTAEEIWSVLGNSAPVAKAGWPVVEQELLRRESVTCIVQINGKVRDRLDVAPDITESDLESLALASSTIQENLNGSTIRKIIIRRPSVVNIVSV
jgi:leucyl-tRNA synthetase